LGVPVLSIGNITCGGTGKTPMTIEIGKKLLAAGLKVGILSRGYKRQSTEPVVIVSDGCGKFASVEEAGDEPLLIAHNLPEAVVIVGRDRRATGSLAASSFFGCQIILLDDGMQHLPLYRDADIVLIDYNDDLSINSLLPAGRLREPLSSLRRASTIVVTKVPSPVDEDKLEKLLSTVKHYAPEAAVNLSRLVPNQLISFTGEERPLSRLKNARIAVFSGLAKPENFRETLAACGAQIVKEFRYADHYWYNESDISSLNKAAASVDLIVTTEKDLVRLHSYSALCALTGKGAGNLAKKLYALQVKVEWTDGMPSLLDRFLKTPASCEVLQK
jgi:tetraacyldisaccharide 4'-kinase